MKPSERYWRVVALTRKCAWYCGADVFDPNYKMNFLTFFVIFCIIIYFLFSFYTIYVEISENWQVILKALCMAGSVVQGITKLSTGIIFRKYFREVCKELGHIYSEYEIKSKRYEELLHQMARRSHRVLQLLALLYLFVASLLVSIPIIYLIVKREKIYVMQFLIPGFDPSTNLGHIVISAVHITCLFFGIFGNFAGDTFFFIFGVNTKIFSEIFKEKIAELNEHLKIDKNQYKTRLILLDIFQWHQQNFWYNRKISDIYFWTVLTQVVTTSFSISLTVFIVVTGGWPAGVAYLIYSFCVLFAYCILGTYAEINNEEILFYVYEANWYNLCYVDQKMLITILMRSQNTLALTVGGLVPLSVNTGLQVTKTIYSFMTMLLNFVE